MAIDKTNPVGRFGCFKVLPLVFDEALSYYEVLCKLRNSLNEVIEQANALVNELGLTDDEVEELKEIVGEGSVDDRIYGAELSAKAYTDEQLAKTGTVLFDGSLVYGNTGADCVSGDLRISDYHSVVVYDEYSSADGGVVCAVVPAITSGQYLITGIGNIGLEMDDSTAGYLIKIYIRYDRATNRLTRSQCVHPDHHGAGEGHVEHDTIVKIVGLF